MATEFLVNNAELKCDKGTTTSQLTVLSTTTVNCNSKKAATKNDYKPNMNIMPFGTCALKPTSSNVCVPVTQPWLKFKNNVFHQEKNAITTESCLFCNIGGVIKPTNSGQ
jgi:hypothetical protein